jgi:hypothetical protein
MRCLVARSLCGLPSAIVGRGHLKFAAPINRLGDRPRVGGGGLNDGRKSLFDHLVRELLKIQGYGEAKCLWTSQIHRIHPNMPAATMMGIGLMWDFQKRIVHAAVIT